MPTFFADRYRPPLSAWHPGIYAGLLYIKELCACIYEKSLIPGDCQKGWGRQAGLYILLSVLYTVIHQLHMSFLWSGRRVSNPQPPAWKAGALPIELLPLDFLTMSTIATLWGQVDSNHRSRRQQIYSLSHLATLVYPQKKRAEEGTRTPDLLITNQWLYQLSYFGLFFLIFKERPVVIGVANLVTIFIVAKKNKTFFNFFLHFCFNPYAALSLPSRQLSFRHAARFNKICRIAL